MSRVERRVVDPLRSRRRLHPARAVERRQLRRLPVRAIARLDAQHLAPVARPAQRPVAVVPVIARARPGAEILREPLVIEQRAAAVDPRREHERGEDRDRHDRGRHRRGPTLDALEPQEDGEQQREHRATEERVRALVLHRGHEIQDGEHDRGGDREAEPAAAPWREGQQRGKADEHAGSQDDDDPRPRVGPVKRCADVRDGAETLADPGGQVVPGARSREIGRDPGCGECDDEQRQADGCRHERARQASEPSPARGDQDRAGGERGEQRHDRRQRRGGRHHPRPRRATEGGEREEPAQARGRDRQARVGGPAARGPERLAQRGLRPARDAHARSRVAARVAGRGRRPPTT